MTTNLALSMLIWLATTAIAGADTPSLTPQTPIALSGASGKFDYLVADNPNHRIFGSHPGAKGVVIIDTAAGTASSLDLGVVVNGVAVARRAGKVYFAGGGKEILAYDLKTLQKVSEIDLDSPADDISLDPSSGMLYVDQDDGDHLWVVDTKTDKIVGTVPIGGAPEFLVYDKSTDKLYQNIKSTNSVQVIDPASNTVVETWPTAPATAPHGLAVDVKGGRLFSAGRNGQLVEIDLKTGKVMASTEIAPGVDQIAYDSKAKRVYCAGAGIISVVEADDDDFKLLDKIQAGGSAHTLAVDSSTGNVWVAYADADKSYVQCLKATGQREAD